MLPYNINNINVVLGVVIFIGYSSCCRVMALGLPTAVDQCAGGRKPICPRPWAGVSTAVGKQVK